MDNRPTHKDLRRVNLGAAEIGDRALTRHGKVVTLTRINHQSTFPYRWEHEGRTLVETRETGCSYRRDFAHPFDIVMLLDE